jgi:hypothetical protein
VAYRVGSGNFTACAPATVDLTERDCGRAAALAFIGDNANRPVVIGLLRGNLPPDGFSEKSEPTSWNVEASGQRIVLSAAEEIVLRCGKSSVTLTRAGKVIVRGAYVLSRASGVNRIKGASVQIN